MKIVMTWDALSDVDLDVIEPDGTRIYHGSRTSKVGGVYSADNARGLGPECSTVARLRPGIWGIGAHLHSGPRSVVKFVVVLYGDTPREQRREETLTLETPGDQSTFIKDVVVRPWRSAGLKADWDKWVNSAHRRAAFPRIPAGTGVASP